MSRNLLIVAAVVVIVVLAGLAYAVFRTPEEASAPIQAVPLAVNTEQPTVAPTTTPVVEATQAPVSEPTAAPEPTATPEPAATQTPEATVAVEQPTVEAQPTEAPAAASEPILFEIVQAESEARFIIDEVLRGAPKRVVGVTDQVAGQISVDPADPTSAQVGQMLVNARTLVTDNDFRNRAVKNRILQTDTYEFVTFQPTQLVGLPESAAVGEPFAFQITGDLTVRDTTKTVTFDVIVTPVDQTRLEGLATLTFPYRDFGLVIPDAPAVDTVADDVTLELQFVALATQ